MNSKRVTVKIGKEQFEKIQREREITKVPQIHIINQAIDQYFESKGNEQENINTIEERKNLSNILSIDPKGNMICYDKNGILRYDLNSNMSDEDQVSVFGKVILKTINHGKGGS